MTTQARGDHNSYILGRIGRNNVAIAVLPDGEPGIAAAADVANDMLHTFRNIRIGVLVGIGGGAPSSTNDIRLGDVVVSSKDDKQGKHGGVFQYDYGRTIQDQEFHYTGYLNRPPRALRTAVTAIRTRHELRGSQIREKVQAMLAAHPRLQRRYRQPDPLTDRLYRSTVVHQGHNVQDTCWNTCGNGPNVLVQRTERTDALGDSVIHYGLVASANQEMNDAIIRDRLSEQKGVLCFEREAAGLMNNFPCLVIRGVCDYADTHPNDDWKYYAAAAAAAYAKDLLSQVVPEQVEDERPVEPSTARPPSGGNDQPGCTVQPGAVSQPSNTPQPGDTVQPGGGYEPGDAPQPGDNSQPGGGHQPGTTPQPGSNDQSSTISQPGGTSQPGVSHQPSDPSQHSQSECNCQPGSTSQSSGNCQPGSQVQTGYIDRIGHFPKHEIDEAIRRDKCGFEIALRTLVNGIDLVNGHGGAWAPLGHRLIDFQKEWNITEPQLREGKKQAQGNKWDRWQQIRRDRSFSTQKRFHAAHNEFLAFSNDWAFDHTIGFASMQRVLWSVWRVMEYMGIAEEV